MNGRKWIALLLALVLAATASACGRKTYVEAYDTTPPIDFDETYALYEPETVVLYVEDEPVTWRELYYEIVYYARLIEGSEGLPLRSWDQICASISDANGAHQTYGELALNNALMVITQYHTMHSLLTKQGVTLSAEGQAAADAVRSQVISESFGGDEQAFLDYLESMYCTDAMWRWFNEVDALYQYDGFIHYYGPFGSGLSDEDVFAYAAGDPNGNWTEYVQIKQLVLYKAEEGSGEAGTVKPDPETEAAIEAALGGAEASGEASGSTEEAFDEMYALYNEEPNLDYFTGGRAVYRGDTDDSVYAVALALDEGEWRKVAIDSADVYILRVALDPDAGVLYDAGTGTMYTLRYYAAWQSYSDMVNGPDGWLAGASARWADGFEDFSLI